MGYFKEWTTFMTFITKTSATKKTELSILVLEKISRALEEVSQGAVLSVYHKGSQVIRTSFGASSGASSGASYKYYDLASLTKIIFTVTAIMKAVDEEKISIKKKIGQIKGLAWFPYTEITLEQLLTHCSGLPWWLPFYEAKKTGNKNGNEDVNIKDFLIREFSNKNFYEASLKKNNCVYSDVGFWVLGFVLESVYDKPLFQIWEQLKKDFLNSSKDNPQNFYMDFHVQNKPLKEIFNYAPTQDKDFRGGRVQGISDDDNCWAMGGVAPHAGLFASIEGVEQWVKQIRSCYLGENSFISKKTLKQFTRRQLPESVGDWGLGFMKPTFAKASCGKLFSPDSFGHTGFTGTSIWYDPTQDVQVILLTNSVYSNNNSFKTLRPQIHDWIMQEIAENNC